MAVPEDTGFPLTWFKNKKYVRNTYECAVCLEVVRNPVQTRCCGRQFCRYCIDDVLKTQTQCPTCRDDISEETVFDDKAANRAIGELEVNCPNKRCKWNGSLNYLLGEHPARCPFTVLNCSIVGCDMQIIRKDLEVHLTAKCEHRTVVCEHCTSEHMFKEKAAHLETCTHLPVKCINKCSLGKVPRNEMEAHIQTTCPKTAIKCKYLEFGCEHECERRQMEEHLENSMKSHLDLSMIEISRLKMVTATTSVIPPIMIITDFHRKLSEAKEKNVPGSISGSPFYASPHGYKLKMKVELNERREEYKDYTGVYICVMKSDHDAILSWPFKKKYTFTLIDQQDNEEERENIVKTFTPGGQDEFKRPIKKENEGYGYPIFVSHARLETRKYIKDDTVFITVSIEQ